LVRLRDPRLSLGYERIDRHAAVGELFVAPARPERLQQVVAAICESTLQTLTFAPVCPKSNSA
jgi:hypothetical protein